MRRRARHARAGRAAAAAANARSRSSCSSSAARSRAAIAVEHGASSTASGGTSGPIGMRGAGALDGEVAFLAGSDLQTTAVHRRGRDDRRNAGRPGRGNARPATTARPPGLGGVSRKRGEGCRPLAVSAPRAREVIVSGRLARVASVRDELTRRLAGGDLRRAAGPRAHRLRHGRQAGRAGRGAAGRRPRRRHVGAARRRAGHSRRDGHGARLTCTSSRRPRRGRGSGSASDTRARRRRVDTRGRRIGGARRLRRHGHRRLRRSRSASLGAGACRWRAASRAHAAARAARTIECDAVVYLSNFENHPRAVDMLAAGRALWGNTPTRCAACRDPLVLADTLRRQGFAVPEVSFSLEPRRRWARTRRPGS